jgi:circadian clock protein KaiC
MTTAVKPLPRLPTGIPGFDDLCGGGLIRSRLTVTVGSPGTGKSLFALQTLLHGARELDEPGLYVTFEESPDEIRTNAESIGWDLTGLGSRFTLVDARVSPSLIHDGRFELSGMLAALGHQVAELGVRRIAIDGIDSLLRNLASTGYVQRELERVRDWLREIDASGIVTAKARPDDPERATYEFSEYMADCLVVLEHQVEGATALRSVRVQKLRGGAHSSNRHPMVIGPRGLLVLASPSMEMSHPASSERVSTGISGLDDMLGGGYFRGSSVLVSGAPGTAKSTLAAAFLAAGAQRGEDGVYVSLDESPQQVVRNLRSVGIDLRAPEVSERIRLYGLYSGNLSSGDRVTRILDLVQGGCRSLVIDPVSSLIGARADRSAPAALQRLLYECKRRQITTFFTSLLEGQGALTEETEAGISALADTWMHLSYMVQAGERNRALTIVKSRGMKHSSQVRELVLHEGGIHLQEVYTAGGAVLMGTLRWEKEEEERLQQVQRARAAERRRYELELLLAESAHKVAALEEESRLRRAELESLRTSAALEDELLRERRRGIRYRRAGDPGPAIEGGSTED